MSVTQRQSSSVLTDPYVALARESLGVHSFHTVLPLRNSARTAYLPGRRLCLSEKFGELRGCISTIAPVQENLAQEIISNATSAGTRDLGFFRLRKGAAI
ncbi:MAG: AMMECR1 domain-containing protein [[Clostridium] innocuum]